MRNTRPLKSDAVVGNHVGSEVELVQLAAVAIANRILELGEPAAKDYKKFLSGGSSTDPISLLKIAGVDMSSPEPVNSALKLFGELVDELEQLML